MKQKKTALNRLACLALASLLLGACTTDLDWKKVEDEHLNGQALAIPLGYLNTTIDEVLAKATQNKNKRVKADGELIYLHYVDTMEWKIRAYEMKIDSDPVVREYSPGGNGLAAFPANSSHHVSFVETVELGVNSNTLEQRADSIKFSLARMNLNLTSNIAGVQPKDIRLVVTFPDQRLVFDNPNITDVSFTPDAFGADKSVEMPPFTIKTPGSATSIPMKVDLYIKTGATPVPLTPASKLKWDIRLLENKMKVAYGYFKPSETNSYKYYEVDLGSFERSLPKGLIGFMEPKVDVTFINKQGINCGFRLHHAKAYRRGEADYDTIFAKFKDGSQSMSTTIKPALRYGEKTLTKYTVDKDSGEMHRFFTREKLPNMVAYKYSLTNQPRAATDFITSEPKIDVVFDSRLPFYFQPGSYVQLKDTMKNLGLDSIFHKQEIEKALLLLHVTNGLPVQAHLRLRLLDKNNKKINTTIDSIFTVNAAPVKADGFVDRTRVSTQEIKVDLDKNKIAELRKAHHMSYSLRIDRSNAAEMFKVEASNTLNVKAGIYIKGNKTMNYFTGN